MQGQPDLAAGLREREDRSLKDPLGAQHHEHHSLQGRRVARRCCGGDKAAVVSEQAHSERVGSQRCAAAQVLPLAEVCSRVSRSGARKVPEAGREVNLGEPPELEGMFKAITSPGVSG